MPVPAAQQDLSNVVFVRDETTSRTEPTSRSLAIEINGLLEECIARLSHDPKPVLESASGDHAARRTFELETRWGTIEGSTNKGSPGRGTSVQLGSLRIETPVPWTRPRPRDLSAVLSFCREAVRAVVLHEPGDEARRDAAALCAETMAAHPEATCATIACANPWQPGGISINTRKAFVTLKAPLRNPRRIMQVHLTKPADAVGGDARITRLAITPLSVSMYEPLNPVERMRLLARAARIP